MPNRYATPGVQPFWFWNGTITGDEIRRQIREMRRGGLRGFFLHPRQGMDLPYLSDAFFERVKDACEAAKAESMEMWLYDEYPYPSGVGGGELLLEPSYRCKVVTPLRFDTEGGRVQRDLRWGKVLYAKAFPVSDGAVRRNEGVDLREKIGIVYDSEIYQGNTGLSLYNRKRFFTGGHNKRLLWDAAPGQWRVYVYIEHELEDFKYFGGFVDPLNPDAVSAYIEHTHEAYRKHLGGYFGSTIKGIFTDEVAPVSEAGVAWSPLLPDWFQRKYGYDLIERLPALWGDDDGDRDEAKFRYDYQALVCDAFQRSYDIPVRAWCERNGLIYTGEKPHMRCEQIGHMAIPGIDNGHQKVGVEPDLYPAKYRANAKCVSSYAHFRGDGRALCEAYHSLGWGATLRDLRYMADWLAALGIDFLVPHAAYYSEDALRKYDAPPSLFENMPWWAINGLFTGHVEQVQKRNCEGKRLASVLVADPVADGWAKGLAQPGEALAHTQRLLGEAHIDYYVIDRDLQAECETRDGAFFLQGERFYAMVVPEMLCAESALYALAERARNAGAPVYCVSSAPERIIDTGERCTLPGAMALPPEALADALAQTARPALRITVNGAECADILAAAWSMENGVDAFVLHMSGEEKSVRVSVLESLLPANAPGVTRVNDNGEAETALRSACSDGYLTAELSLAPYESAILRFGRKVDTKVAETIPADVPIDLTGQLPLRIEQGANLLRLAEWTADFGDGVPVQVEPMPVIDQLTGGRVRIPAQERSGFGCLKRLVFPGVQARYTTRFRCESEGAISLALEPGAILGEHRILINGIECDARLEPRRVYSRENIACDVTDCIRKGVNEIVVEVTCARDFDGLRSPLYLHGAFGVYRDADGAFILRSAAMQGAPALPAACGMPFFSGAVSFDITTQLAPFAGRTAWIRLTGAPFEQAAELIIDGKSTGARAWDPYRWTVDIPKDLGEARLRIYNTLLPAYEGAQFDLDSHSTIPM